MYSYENLPPFSYRMLLCPFARRFSKAYTTHVVYVFDVNKHEREILIESVCYVYLRPSRLRGCLCLCLKQEEAAAAAEARQLRAPRQ